MDKIQLDILDKIAGIKDIPTTGAYNIRLNGKSAGCSSTEGVTITFKENGTGINIHVKPGAKERVHIPVVVSAQGHAEIVYNDFFIGEDSDITIVAGCGIHNACSSTAQHDGIHTFYLAKNSKVKYVEKHYGEGEGTGERILNPITDIYMEPGSYMEIETVQIKGVDSTKRLTKAELKENASLIVSEKLMTHESQYAETEFDVSLNGENSGTHVISRSVAKGSSKQVFLSKIKGNNTCTGHSECDAIIMDNAIVQAIPEISANNVGASLIHEAAIGKIAGEQIVKLMTLGLTEHEAIEQIVAGFLK